MSDERPGIMPDIGLVPGSYRQGELTDRLQASYRLGRVDNKSPAELLKAFEEGKRANVPLEYAKRDIPGVADQNTESDLEKLATTNPVTAQYLTSSPDIAVIGAERAERLKRLEDTIRMAQRGLLDPDALAERATEVAAKQIELETEGRRILRRKPRDERPLIGNINEAIEYTHDMITRNHLLYDQMWGDTTGDERIDQLQEKWIGRDEPEEFIDYALASGAEFGTYQVESTIRALPEAATGGVTGALAGFLAGQAGPQALSPFEDIPLTTAGFTIGAQTALHSARWTDMAQLEAGAAWDEIRGFEDAEGNKIDEDIVRAAAMSVGIINASAEYVGISSVLSTLSRGSARAVVRKAMRKAMQSPQFLKLMGGIVARQGEAIGVETATEVFQEVTPIIAGEIAKIIDEDFVRDETVLGAIFSEDTFERVSEVAKKTAVGVGVITLPGQSVRIPGAVREARQSARLRNMNEQLLRLADESGLKKDGPEFLNTFLQEVGGGHEVVIPGEDLAILATDDQMSVELEKIGITPQLIDQADKYKYGIKYNTATAISRMGSEQAEELMNASTIVGETTALGSDHVASVVKEVETAAEILGELDKTDEYGEQLGRLRKEMRAAAEQSREVSRQIAAAPEIESVKDFVQTNLENVDAYAKRMAIDGKDAVDFLSRITVGFDPDLGVSIQRVEEVAPAVEPVADEFTTDVTYDQEGQIETRTPEFQAWFGESKVVGEQGEPLTVYHSTSAPEFDAFNKNSHFGTIEAAAERAGILTEFARDVVGRDPGDFRIIPVHLSISNPLRMPDLATIDDETGEIVDSAEDISGESRVRAWEAEEDLSVTLLEQGIIDIDEFEENRSPDDVIELLKEKGYDGIVYENAVEDKGSDSYIAFEPNQIKATSNLRPTEAPGIFQQVSPPFRPGTAPFEEFREGLTPQARETFEQLLQINTIDRQVANDAFQRYVRAEDWNKLVTSQANVQEAAQMVVSMLPEAQRAQMRLNDDGTITESDFDKEFDIKTSFMQRVIDSMPSERVPSKMRLVTGQVVDMMGGETDELIVNGGEAYRRALLQQKRDRFLNGAIREVSIGTLSRDNWGALGFLAENSKTFGSADFTTICPQMFYNRGCFYCYRRAALETGVNVKLAAQRIWYTGEILQMKDEDIKRLNEVGGLRIQSFGDWMGQRDQAQFTDFLLDAEARGLQVKIITKEPAMIEYTAHLKEQGLANNVFFNLSTDYVVEEAGEIGASQFYDPVNPNRPIARTPEGRPVWKRALSVDEAQVFADKYDWVNIRTVALDTPQFLESLRDPRVKVVTGYHGNIREPDSYIAGAEDFTQAVEVEPLGDFGMPGFNDAGTELTGKTAAGQPLDKRRQGLAEEIQAAGLEREYAEKSCCVFGNCAECRVKCGAPVQSKDALNGEVRFPLRDEYLELRGNQPVDTVVVGEEELGTPTGDIDQDFVQRDEFYQRGEGRDAIVRGRTVVTDRNYLVQVSHNANLSTFLHEFSHVFLEEMFSAVVTGAASQRMIDDANTLLDWFAKELNLPQDITWDGMTQDQRKRAHELMARANEAYFLAGKSPSVKLERTFERAREWMLHVYTDIQGIIRDADMDINVTEQVTQVFNRMLATEAETKDAEIANRSVELTQTEAETIGLSDDELDKVNEQIAIAMRKGKSALVAQREADLKDLTQVWRDEITAQIDADPTYQAAAFIRSKGENPAFATGGLNLQALRDSGYGDFVADLRRRGLIAKKDEVGKLPDVVASMFNFMDTDELILSLVDMIPRTKAIAMHIEAQTNAYMREVPADEAIIDTDAYSKALDTLGAFLVKRTGARGKRSAASYRNMALKQMEGLSFRDLTDTRKYLGDYQRYAKSERDILAKGLRKDGSEITDRAQRLREALMEHHAARVAQEKLRIARDLKARREKMRKLIVKVAKRPTKGQRAKLDFQHRENIKHLSNRYNITGRNYPVDPDRVELRRIAGITDPVIQAGPSFSDQILEDSRTGDLMDMTRQQFLELESLISFLDSQGRQTLKDELFRGAERREDVIFQLLEASEKLKNIREFEESNPLVRLVQGTIRGWDEFSARRLQLLFILRMADGLTNLGPGGTAGPYETLLYDRIEDSYRKEQDVLEDMKKRLEAPMKQLEDSMVKAPAFLDVGVPYPEVLQGRFRKSWTFERILAVALNMGNRYQLDAMARGFGWGEFRTMTEETGRERQVWVTDEAIIHRVVAPLTKADWQAVQSIWDSLSSMWPQMNAVHKRRFGLGREQVQPTPFLIKPADDESFTVAGGYYPMKFDAKKNLRQAEQEIEDELLVSNMNLFPTVHTYSGFMRERTDSGGKPMRLDINVMLEHISHAARYIAYTENLIDIATVLRDPRVASTLSKKLGEAVYKQIMPELSQIAQPERVHLHPEEKWLSRQRMMATKYILGLNVSVAVKQPFSWFGVVQEIGLNSSINGVWKALTGGGHHAEAKMKELSQVMRNRTKTFDRELQDIIGGWRKKYGLLWRIGRSIGLKDGVIDEFVFAPIKAFDHVTVVPTWWGGYHHALKRGMSEEDAIRFADKLVVSTQPSNRIIDQSAFQRNRNGMIRLFTSFMSFTMKFGNRSTIYNRMAKEQGVKAAGAYVRQFLIERIVPPMLMTGLMDLLTGDLPDDDDDWKRYAVSTVTYQFAGLPLFRELASTAAYFITKEGFRRELSASPAFTGLEILERTMSNTMAAMNGDKDAWPAIRAWGDLLSFKMGVPASRVVDKTVEGYRQATEELEGVPQNILWPHPDRRQR